MFLKAPLDKIPPIEYKILDFISFLTILENTFTIPSDNFNITLPTNPSHTITSASPSGISLPSILPIKFIFFVCSKSS